MDLIPNFAKNTSLDLILNLSPHPMWVFDIATLKFLKVNNEAIKQYGFSNKEFLTMTLKDIRPKEDFSKLKIAIDNIQHRNGTHNESYFRHKKKNGTIFPVMLKSNLITIEKINAEIVSAIDISKTIEYEKKLQYQTRIFQSISDINTNLIRNSNWHNALDTCFGIICETLKVDRVYFFQSNLQNKTISQKLLKTRNSVESDLQSPNFQNVSFSFLNTLMSPLRNGHKFEGRISELTDSYTKEMLENRKVKSILALPIIANSEFRGFIGLDDCKDEREWSNEEFQLLDTLTTNLSHLIVHADSLEEIKDSEQRFKTLVQKGTGMISIIDLDGNYKYVAPMHHNVLGFQAEELTGTSFFNSIFPDDVPKLKESFQKILKEEQVKIPPYRYIDSKGSFKWLKTVLTNHLSEFTINGIVANTSDITEQVQNKITRNLINSLSTSIGRQGTLKECLSSALATMVGIPIIDASEIWLMSKDASQLNLMATQFESEIGERFYKHKNTLDKFEKGVGLPGNVWKTKKQVVWEDLPNRSSFKRSEAARDARLNTAIGIPIFNNRNFLGCLVIFSKSLKSDLTKTLYLFNKLGHKLGAIIKQKIIEEEFLNFFEISPEPFFVIGFDGKIKQVNNASIKALGYSKKQLLGFKYENFVHKTELKILNEKFKTGVHTGINEIRMITNQNEVRWFVWSITVRKEEKIVLVVAKDISEQKLAEKSLKLAYEKLKKAQEIAKLGYWYRSLKSETIEWSPETYKIFGYTPQNFTPTRNNLMKAYHPEDQYLMDSNPNNQMEPGKVTSFEHRIINASGEVRWVDQEIQIILDEQGQPSHVEGTIQDISKKKEYEEQLEDTNERFHLAMLASNQMIWELNHESNIQLRTHVDDRKNNRLIEEVFSIKNSWFKKIHPDDLQEVWNVLNKNISDKNKQFWSLEYRVILEDGQIAHLVDKCYIIRDKNGNPTRTIGTVMDITVSKHHLEKIKYQNKTLKDIAWLHSHNIRAPLTRIMSLIYLNKKFGKSGLSNDKLFGAISSSVDEIDNEIHKIIEIMPKNSSND